MGRKIIRDYILGEVKKGCVAWSGDQNVSHAFRYELDINKQQKKYVLGSENDVDKDPGVAEQSAKNLQLVRP